MVYDSDEIVKRALDSKTNVPGTCQYWTRTIIGVDSAGDQDGDGDADAVDGWKSEPLKHRHSVNAQDYSPPKKGRPVAFSGGSSGYGHRAIAIGHGLIRSTDMSDDGKSWQPGNVGTTTIEDIERCMGVNYLGWSDTMSGVLIPDPPPPTRGEKVDHALKDLNNAKSKKGSRRRELIERAKRILRKIKPHRPN